MATVGDVIEIPRTGEKFVFLRRARDTQGEVFEIEFFVREFALVAARPHIHATTEERLQVIAGTARVQMGREEQIVGAGEAVVIPAGMVHSIRRQGEEFLHFRLQMRPAMKIETMFETLIGLHHDGKNFRNLLLGAVLAKENGTYLAGLPIWLQKPIIAVAAAIGRIFGYRARYERYSGPELQA
jgi:mannose-6-phosphate isomerase-like protein (cupin superfamily)